MLFFHIIEVIVMYENDWYCPTKGTKQFLLILINHYVAILLLYIHPNCYKKILTFFSSSIRMSRKNVNFGDKNIKKDNTRK